MNGVFFRWVVLTLAVWVATALVPGIRFDSWQSLVIAALVLGILNAFVKPLLLLVSLPLLMFTLGLFIIVINALLLLLTDKLVSGFHVSSFWSAVLGSLIISIVSLFFGAGRRNPPRRRPVMNEPEAPRPQRGPPPGKGPIIDV